MNRWSQNDPYAAGAWLGTVPPGESRDAAVNAFARRIVSSDPAAAVQWAQTVANKGMRNSQLETIASAWMRTDPNSAAAWIASSSLPNDVKARLLPPRR